MSFAFTFAALAFSLAFATFAFSFATFSFATFSFATFSFTFAAFTFTGLLLLRILGLFIGVLFLLFRLGALRNTLGDYLGRLEVFCFGCGKILCLVERVSLTLQPNGEIHSNLTLVGQVLHRINRRILGILRHILEGSAKCGNAVVGLT